MKSILGDLKKSTIPMVVITISFLIYFFTDVYCGDACGLVQDGDKQSIFISGLLWFMPTLLVLIFFGSKVTADWLRHIGWWFSILFPAIVIKFIGGGVLSMDDIAVKVMMILLFIITLVYTPITERRLKKSGQA
jgi:hypothetical protein